MRPPSGRILRIATYMTLFTAAANVGPSAAVTVHVPGYSYGPLASVPATAPATDLELDAVGNVYSCILGDIRRITPDGVVSAWSSATAVDLVFSPTGEAYGTGKSLCHCILSLNAIGASSALHADSLEWSFVTLGKDGTLFATVEAGIGVGLYAIDRASGAASSLVSGGPGPSGAGVYESMMIGLDGKLYTCGGSVGAVNIFRFDGGQFTSVIALHGGIGLAQDNQGVFYSSGPVEHPDGSTTHAVWMMDPNVGTPTLLADGPNGPGGVAYDRLRNRLYVLDSAGNVYFIEKSATPTIRTTWSALKKSYR